MTLILSADSLQVHIPLPHQAILSFCKCVSKHPHLLLNLFFLVYVCVLCMSVYMCGHICVSVCVTTGAHAYVNIHVET